MNIVSTFVFILKILFSSEYSNYEDGAFDDTLNHENYANAPEDPGHQNFYYSLLNMHNKDYDSEDIYSEQMEINRKDGVEIDVKYNADEDMDEDLRMQVGVNDDGDYTDEDMACVGEDSMNNTNIFNEMTLTNQKVTFLFSII